MVAGSATAELTLLVFSLVGLLFALAGAIWWLAGMANRCVHCTHCQGIMREEKRREQEKRASLGYPALDKTFDETGKPVPSVHAPEEEPSGDRDADT